MNEPTVGPELDAAVAEKVMGESMPAFPPSIDDADLNLFAGADYRSPGGCWIASSTGYEDGDRPIWVPLAYSTNISRAWLVVEKMRKTFRRFEVHALADCFCCLVEEGSRDIDSSYIADSESDTAPEAICRAALEAVELCGRRGLRRLLRADEARR